MALTLAPGVEAGDACARRRGNQEWPSSAAWLMILCVIPQTSLDLSFDIPSTYRYGRPRREDVSEEGFGGFRGTWLLHGAVGVRDARQVIRDERELVEILDGAALTADEFDAIALAFERGYGELPERLVPGPLADLATTMEREANEGESRLHGLDVGVAGLVYALSATGFWTAASCRGHVGSSPWSDRPVVLFATDEHRAMVLRPFVERAACGFAEAGPDLLAVEAKSIEGTMRLAELVLSQPRAFRQPRGVRGGIKASSRGGNANRRENQLTFQDLLVD